MGLRTVAAGLSVTAVIFASGCSGSAAGNPGAMPDPGAIASRSVASRVRTSTQLVIKIPHRHRRRGRFISPSTVSASFSVSPATGCSECSPAFTKNYYLVAPSQYCTATASATTCAFPLALVPGSYAGSLATYDGWNGAPTGNVLSQNQLFAFDVVKGRANVPAITLDGLTSYMQMLGLSDGTLALSTSGGRFLIEVASGTSGRLQIVAYDADGDAILGPGAPTFNVTATGSFTSSVNGNVVTLTAPSQPAKGYYSLTVSPSTCISQPVSNCAAVAKLAFLPIVAVSYGTNVEVQRTSRAAAPGNELATIGGFNAVGPVQFDKNGNLFVLDEGTGPSHPTTVREFAPPYNGTPVATITETNDVAPTAMAVAPNGSVAITDNSSASVGVYASNGSRVSTTPISPPFSFGIGTPGSLAFDSDNNVWCGSDVGNVAELTAASNYTTIGTLFAGVNDPVSMAFDAANNIYVGDNGTGSVKEFDAPGYTTSSVTAITGLAGVTQITRDETPFWLTGKIEAYAGPSGTSLVDYPVSNIASLLAQSTIPGNFVAFDQDGNLYYSINAAGKIGLIFGVDAYTNTGELQVASGSDVPSGLAAFPGP
jgi:hypothetical protein